MHLFRMPLFCWTRSCTAILMIFAMPPLTVATAMLALDRYAGFHFFTNGAGGNMMNYANLFWLFGHPEVYILILPAFGVWSEVISHLLGQDGFTATPRWCWRRCAIAVLSASPSGCITSSPWDKAPNVNAAFGIATMLIGIPTGREGL